MDELAPLVIAAQAGDLKAFDRIISQIRPDALLIARNKLPDSYLAEDAVQEAFIEVYQNLCKLRNPEAFPGWFRLIVIKHCDRLRRGRRLQTVPYEEGTVGWENRPGLNMDILEMRLFVKSQVDRLSRKQQTVAALFIAGYSPKEIAELLELPLTTVRKRLYDARSQLRKWIDGKALASLHELEKVQCSVSSFFTEGLEPGPPSRDKGLRLSTTLPVGRHPAGVAVNSHTKRLYVVNEAVGEPTGSLSIIDSGTYESVATLSLGRRPQDIAVNAETNRLYITHYFLRSLWVFDGTSHALIGTIPLAGNPTRVDVNLRNNRVYVGTMADSAQGGTFAGLSVIDGTTHTLIATIPIGSQTRAQVGPTCVKVNSVTQQIYVAKDGFLAILGESHKQISHVSGLGTVTDIGINPCINCFYLSRSLSPKDSVMVGDGATHAIIASIPIDDESTGLDVDSSSGRIYVTHYKKGAVSLLSGKENSLISVIPFSKTVPFPMGCHGGVKVDPSTHNIYISCQDVGVLFVLEDQCNEPVKH